MGQSKRKHVATGAPRGGRRRGAGRRKGSPNTLGYGEVKAVRVANLRVPEGTAPEAAALADRAQQRLIDVMEAEVGAFQAGHVLKAAVRIREEICGPLTQKVEHHVQLEDLTDEQLEAKHRAIQERIAAAEKEPAP